MHIVCVETSCSIIDFLDVKLPDDATVTPMTPHSSVVLDMAEMYRKNRIVLNFEVQMTKMHSLIMTENNNHPVHRRSILDH